MSQVVVYTFEDEDGNEMVYRETNGHLARQLAQRQGLRLIENTYEWVDSEMVADHTHKEDSR